MPFYRPAGGKAPLVLQFGAIRYPLNGQVKVPFEHAEYAESLVAAGYLERSDQAFPPFPLAPGLLAFSPESPAPPKFETPEPKPDTAGFEVSRDPVSTPSLEEKLREPDSKPAIKRGGRRR